MGHPVLRERAKPVERFGTPELRALLADMKDTMAARNGAGLAAPQIGVGAARRDLRRAEESALSRRRGSAVHGAREPEDPAAHARGRGGLGRVPLGARHARRGAALHAAALHGLRRGGPIRSTATADGFHARVVQHECDHLDGILYPHAHDRHEQASASTKSFSPGRTWSMSEIAQDAGQAPGTGTAQVLYLLHLLAPFTAWLLAVVAIVVGMFTRDACAAPGSRRTTRGSRAPSGGGCCGSDLRRDHRRPLHHHHRHPRLVAAVGGPLHLVPLPRDPRLAPAERPQARALSARGRVP